MDTAAVIAALSGTIATLAGAVALLYRAQVKALEDRCSDLKSQFEERLHEKNDAIEGWQKQADKNGAGWKDESEVTKRMQGTLDSILDELRDARRSRGGRA